MAVAPTISGTHATSTTADTPVSPFWAPSSPVTIGNSNVGATDTLTIALSNDGATGLLSGIGLSGGTNGFYTLTGTAATITAELDDLEFTPATGAPGGSDTTTTFALSDLSSGFGTPTVDEATTVTDTDALVTPTISGARSTSTTADEPVNPFSAMTIHDVNTNASDYLIFTLSNGANGTLTSPVGNLADNGGGVYTLDEPPALINAAIQALTFTPAAGAPGSVTTTTLTLTAYSIGYVSGYSAPATNNATTVTDIDAVAPTISGTHPDSPVSGPVNLFSGVTISDSNVGATDALTIALSNDANGLLSGTGLSADDGGVYTLTGTAATITTDLDAVVFTPGTGAPGVPTTTTFALSDLSSSFGTPTTDDATRVTDPYTVAPTISGTHATSTTLDRSVNPFSGVTIGDLNVGATDTLDISLSNDGTGPNGTLTGAVAVPGDAYYILTGTAAAITAALGDVTFTPAAGAPGSITTTTFHLSDLSSSGYGGSAAYATTTVTDTDPAVAPTLQDILWRNASTGGVELWSPNGSGGFTYDNLGAVSTSWQIQGQGISPAAAKTASCGATRRPAPSSSGIRMVRVASPMKAWALSTPVGKSRELEISLGRARTASCGATRRLGVSSSGTRMARGTSLTTIWASSTPPGRSREPQTSPAAAKTKSCGATRRPGVSSSGTRMAQGASPTIIWALSTPIGRSRRPGISPATAQTTSCGATRRTAMSSSGTRTARGASPTRTSALSAPVGRSQTPAISRAAARTASSGATRQAGLLSSGIRMVRGASPTIIWAPSAPVGLCIKVSLKSRVPSLGPRVATLATTATLLPRVAGVALIPIPQISFGLPHLKRLDAARCGRFGRAFEGESTTANACGDIGDIGDKGAIVALCFPARLCGDTGDTGDDIPKDVAHVSMSPSRASKSPCRRWRLMERPSRSKGFPPR